MRLTLNDRRSFLKAAVMAVPGTAITQSRLGSAQINLETEIAGLKYGIVTGSLDPPKLETLSGRLSSEWSVRDEPEVVIRGAIELGTKNLEYIGPSLGGPDLIQGGIHGKLPSTTTPAYLESRRRLREWRLQVPPNLFLQLRRQLNTAGLVWFSAIRAFTEDFSDAEIDATFRHMQAMGVSRFSTNDTRLEVAPRLIPFAEKYKITPAFHNHDRFEDTNEIASAASLLRLMAMSPLFMINLDIGHFTAANEDPLAFIKAHHSRITHIHVKDRRRNHGPRVEWGAGDTPIKECLRLIRDRKYPIYAMVEREHPIPVGSSPILETKKCIDYMRAALI